MKKKILKATCFVAFALITGYSLYMSQNSETSLPSLVMDNVEALADATEDTSPGSPCYKGSYNSRLPEATKCTHPCTKERCGGVIDKCY